MTVHGAMGSPRTVEPARRACAASTHRRKTCHMACCGPSTPRATGVRSSGELRDACACEDRLNAIGPVPCLACQEDPSKARAAGPVVADGRRARRHAWRACCIDGAQLASRGPRARASGMQSAVQHEHEHEHEHADTAQKRMSHVFRLCVRRVSRGDEVLAGGRCFQTRALHTQRPATSRHHVSGRHVGSPRRTFLMAVPSLGQLGAELADLQAQYELLCVGRHKRAHGVGRIAKGQSQHDNGSGGLQPGTVTARDQGEVAPCAEAPRSVQAHRGAGVAAKSGAYRRVHLSCAHDVHAAGAATLGTGGRIPATFRCGFAKGCVATSTRGCGEVRAPRRSVRELLRAAPLRLPPHPITPPPFRVMCSHPVTQARSALMARSASGATQRPAAERGRRATSSQGRAQEAWQGAKMGQHVWWRCDSLSRYRRCMRPRWHDGQL